VLSRLHFIGSPQQLDESEASSISCLEPYVSLHPATRPKRRQEHLWRIQGYGIIRNPEMLNVSLMRSDELRHGHYLKLKVNGGEVH